MVVYLRAAAATLMLFGGFAFQSAHASPGMGRGELFLSMDESTCEQKAQAAFTNAGWNGITGHGTFVKGFKGTFASYITCNAAAAGGVVVNIFVTADQADPDASLERAERVRLQEEMQRQ